jgi:thiamine phosphate synthase YjbQ (UPF0047 family)
MSSSVSHVAFVPDHPRVSVTTLGRVRVRIGEDTCVILSQEHASSLLQDLESALIRLVVREQKYELPLAE